MSIERSSKQSVMGPRLWGEMWLETPQIWASPGRHGHPGAVCKEEGPTRDPEKCPMGVTKKGGVSSDLGEKAICGMWEQKPDFRWVDKSARGKKVP